MLKLSPRRTRLLRDLRDHDAIFNAARDMETILELARGGYLRSFKASNGQLEFALTDLGRDAAK